uniref:Receptor expression-enhancing protein n=1 Tax=Lepeophtheirus salmonis TaxID=72036 RepID=D3PIU6_LEPSM|nr:Receptor expression-enhancing protein 6 [Lepeophtheirus salmonis]
MDKLNQFNAQIKKKLNEKNFITDAMGQIEAKTNVAKIYQVYALFALITLYLIVGWGSHVLCNFIGFLYPAYASFKAIESKSKEDDTQWLMYWVIFSAFGLLEVFTDIILFWIPFYSFFKCAFLIYLMNNGSTSLYRLIRPYVLKYQGSIDDAIKQGQDLAGEMITKAFHGIVGQK